MKLSPKDITAKEKTNEQKLEASVAQVVPIEDANDLENRGVIFISDVITRESLNTPIKKILSLQFEEKFTDSIQIIISSPGGELAATWAFIDIMESSRLNIRTIAVGEVSSGAAMIFIAGDQRIMTPNSTAMFHHLSTFSGGTYPDLLAARKKEDLETKKILNHILHNSKYTSIKQVTDNILLPTDNWLTPKEMKKHGLCDIILKSRRTKRKK